MSYYLGVDLGTTGCRSIVYDRKLTRRGESYYEYGLIQNNNGYVEQNADHWWEMVRKTVKESIQNANLAGGEISGVGLSSQAITIVPVNDRVEPLCNAISWLDTRAEKQAERLLNEFGHKRIFQMTGKRIDAAYSLPKILWLKEERPEVFEQTWKFLSPMDFLIGKLTGNCITDHSMASGTLLYDIAGCRWNSSIIEACGLSEAQLPELKWAGEPAGTIVDLPGVGPKCIVATGAQDQRCASFGAGLRPGVMTVSLGTAGAVCKYRNSVQTGQTDRIGWSAYINKGSWVTEGVINTAAACLRWLRDTMYIGQSYDTINHEAEECMHRGTGLLFYPFLNGPSSPDYFKDAQGCFYGVSLSTERADFALAIMEGIAFQIRNLLEVMDAYEDVQKLVIFGGGAKSDLWCRIIADITGLNVAKPLTAEAASFGAAVLAGIACGEFDRDDPPTIAEEKLYRPDKHVSYYESKYTSYKEIARSLWDNR